MSAVITIILIACWYYTSSSNAVSSQNIFQEFISQSEGTDNEQHNTSFRLAHAALYLTTAELLFGSCIAAAYVKIRRVPCPILPTRMTTGAFHYIGCLFTNCGFALGGASLVQIVKLLEPIETLILVMIVNSTVHSKPLTFTGSTVSSVFLIVCGTSLLLTRGDIGIGSMVPVICALISGICMSLRNVLTKGCKIKIHAKSLGGKVDLDNGIISFTHLMTSGAIFSVVTAITATILYGYSPIKQMSISSVMATTMFFCFYQISSILVLSLTSAPTHSLLNVGKRIVNVLVVTYILAEQLTPLAWSGLVLAAGGGMLYWMEKNNINKGRLQVVTLLILIGSSFSYTLLTLGEISTVDYPGITNMPYNDVKGGVVPSFTNSTRMIKFLASNISICYYNTLNFGDEIGPIVAKKMLEHHFEGSATALPVVNLNDYPIGKRPNDTLCLFVLGSVFHMAKERDHIWGIGINPRYTRHVPKNLTMHSVRGPMTVEFIEQKEGRDLSISLKQRMGDPGFLLPYLFGLKRSKLNETRVCFVAHKNDLKHKFVQNPPANIHIITCAQHWEPALKQIQTCGYVASSSLHGIILADALAIPRMWFQFNNTRTKDSEGSFKYLDYFGSIGEYPGKDWPIRDTTLILDRSKYTNTLTQATQSAIRSRTSASFPYHLFEVV